MHWYPLARTLVAVFVVAPTFAQGRFGPSAVQPATYASPNGRWTLAVDPRRPDGDGPASYVLKHAAEVAWQGERPVTLRAAVVDDAGRVAGYGYSARTAEAELGAFHVVLFGADGKTMLDEAVKREGSRFMHCDPNPRANGVFLQPELDRAIVRVADADVNRRREEWWVCDLAAGKLEFKKLPLEPGDETLLHVVAARSVPATPLVIAQWNKLDFERHRYGARFALLDAELATVWELVLPDDYTIADDEDAEERLLDEVRKDGAVLPNDAPSRFELRLVREKQRVTFEARKDEKGWTVAEVARATYEPPKPQPSPSAPAKLRLREIASATLEGSMAPKGDVRDVEAFSFDAQGRIRFVRREEESDEHSLVLVTTAGRTEHQARVSVPAAEHAWPKWTALAGARWLATTSDPGEDAKTRGWIVHEEGGSVTEIDAFDCPSVEVAAGLPDGGFVVLATIHMKYTQQELLRAFDTTGKARWTVEGDLNEGHLFSPESVCVTTRGEVVVLENIRNRLQVFDAGGNWLREIELEQAWGREPRYPSDIHAGAAGGVLVHDFDASPALVRMKIDGPWDALLEAQFDAKRADQSTTDALPRHAQIAPDGRVWTTDEQVFLRLDASGVADLVVGAAANVDELAEPGACAIDFLGRVLVQDARTGAVHVFDREGKRVRVCKPDPKAVSDPDTIGRIVSAPDGSIRAPAVSYGPERLTFGPDGAWRAVVREADGDVVSVPGSDHTWTATGGALVLRDREAKELARIDRTPDGRFIDGIEDFAVGPDGTLAVLCGATSPVGSIEASSVALYDETARPLRLLSLPSDQRTWHVAAATRRFAVVSGFGADALLLPVEAGAPRTLELPSGSSAWRFGFSPDGAELWALDVQVRRLHRYALPR